MVQSSALPNGKGFWSDRIRGYGNENFNFQLLRERSHMAVLIKLHDCVHVPQKDIKFPEVGYNKSIKPEGSAFALLTEVKLENASPMFRQSPVALTRSILGSWARMTKSSMPQG